MRSVARRLRLASHAATVPLREACCGTTLETKNISSRRPAIASPTLSSDPPSFPYISAVSISVNPRSMPSFSASTSSLRERLLSPMRQVPCPSMGTFSPDRSEIYRIIWLTFDRSCFWPRFPNANNAGHQQSYRHINRFHRRIQNSRAPDGRLAAEWIERIIHPKEKRGGRQRQIRCDNQGFHFNGSLLLSSSAPSVPASASKIICASEECSNRMRNLS